jgi:hypothetical protein
MVLNNHNNFLILKIIHIKIILIQIKTSSKDKMYFIDNKVILTQWGIMEVKEVKVKIKIWDYIDNQVIRYF